MTPEGGWRHCDSGRQAESREGPPGRYRWSAQVPEQGPEPEPEPISIFLLGGQSFTTQPRIRLLVLFQDGGDEAARQRAGPKVTYQRGRGMASSAGGGASGLTSPLVTGCRWGRDSAPPPTSSPPSFQHPLLPLQPRGSPGAPPTHCPAPGGQRHHCHIISHDFTSD